MAIHFSTTDSLSRAPSAAGTATAPATDAAALASPFDLLLMRPAVTGPTEGAAPALATAEGPAEDIDQDGNDSQAQAMVAPVAVLPMLPLDPDPLDTPNLDATTELPEEFVLATTVEPAADPLTFAVDGNLAAVPATTSTAPLLPAQQQNENDSTSGPGDALPKTIVPAMAIAADANAAAELDAQPAVSHPTAESDTGESSDWEQTEDGDSLSDPLPVTAAETPPSGLPPATTTPVDPLPQSNSVLQQPVLPQAPHAESQPVASSQPAASDSRPIDTARLLHRVARAFAAAKDGGEVRLRLSPPELGALVLDVRVHEGALVARLEAETASVRTVLVENLPALRDRLAEQGIRIERFDVDLRQWGGGNPDSSAHQPFQEPSSREQPARERRAPQVAEGIVARTRIVSHDSRRLNVIV